MCIIAGVLLCSPTCGRLESMCGQGHGRENEFYGHAVYNMVICDQEQYPHVNVCDQQSMLWCYVHPTGCSDDPSLLGAVPRDGLEGPSDLRLIPSASPWWDKLFPLFLFPMNPEPLWIGRKGRGVAICEAANTKIAGYPGGGSCNTTPCSQSSC